MMNAGRPSGAIPASAGTGRRNQAVTGSFVDKDNLHSLSARRAQTSFEQLVRPHLEHLYRLAYRFTGTADRAEDLIQDLLVRIYPRCDELSQIDRPRSWLARVMYRMFIDQVRREARAPEVPIVDTGLMADEPGGESDPYAGVADPAPGPEEAAELRFDQERLAVAWEQLSPDHRALLALFDIEGYSLQELETMLEIPRGTIKSRLHRARERLAALVRDMEPSSLLDRVRDNEDQQQ